MSLTSDVRQLLYRYISLILVVLSISAAASGQLPPSPAAISPTQVAAAQATDVKINSVALYPQAISSSNSQSSSSQDFVLEVTGTGFESIADMSKVFIAVLPSTGVKPSPIPALSRSIDNSEILARFTAPADYTLEEIVLSTGEGLFPFSTKTVACDFGRKTTLVPQLLPKNQAGNKYGNGVAKNFHAIQISIVNECPMAIVVPLGGISVDIEPPLPSAGTDECDQNGSLVAFSLDHVTSIYSADRKLTGRRAIYFNTVQALATIGSAVEPFFASGFTKGVSILGGGYTTASKELFVDMSAEQLQNLTSQSFGSTEQVASHGSLQKFVFVPRNEKCKNSTFERELRSGDFRVNWLLSPASTQAPQVQAAPAKATSPKAPSA